MKPAKIILFQINGEPPSGGDEDEGAEVLDAWWNVGVESDVLPDWNSDDE